MSRTIGDIISRIKNPLKAVKQDAFLTDRTVYASVLKHARTLLRRQDSRNKLMRFSSIWQPLEFVDLIEVDKVQAQCSGLTSGCTIKRTKDRLPLFFEGYWGPLLRSVSSIDGSEELQPTTSASYIAISKQKNFKYNKTHYYWFMDGYLFFPDMDWDAVRIEGLFEGDLSRYNCKCDEPCVQKQDQVFSVPDFFDGEIDPLVWKDFGLMLQIPGDDKDNKQNPVR